MAVAIGPIEKSVSAKDLILRLLLVLLAVLFVSRNISNLARFLHPGWALWEFTVKNKRCSKKHVGLLRLHFERLCMRIRNVFIVFALAVGFGVVFSSSSQAVVSCPRVTTLGVVIPKPGPGANLTGCNLTGANLTSTVLSGVNLSGTNLTRATLTGVSSGQITGTPSALPTGWQLVNGYLIGPKAKLSNANITGFDLSNVNLLGVSSGGVVGAPSALPSGWKLIKGYLVGPGANLIGANLIGANLSSVNLSGTNLTSAILTGVTSGSITGTPFALPLNWKVVNGYLAGPGADLRDADFANANIVGVGLTGAQMTGVTSGGIVGIPRSLPTGWKLVKGYLIGPGAKLTNANFSNAVLTGVNLTNIDLSTAIFTGVSSSGVVGVPIALPTGWRIVKGYLVGPGAKLTYAQLTYSDLSGINLANATITGAVFTGSTLTGASSGGIIGVPRALPTGWKLAKGYLVGPETNLSNLDFSGSDFTGANLAGANLTNTNLVTTKLLAVSSGNIVGTPLLAESWDLVNGYLVGPGARLLNVNFSNTSLAGCVLTSANLTGANLTNADLYGASLFGTNLTGATLTGVSSGFVSGGPIGLPTGWKVIKGYLIGPTANLSDADLSDANLTGANFTDTNLTNADLTGAKFISTNLAGANLTNADLIAVYSSGIVGTPKTLPTGWKLVNGYLIGLGANLTNANLQSANLVNADLRYANLLGTKLTGANISGADLTDAFMFGNSYGAVTGIPAGLSEDWRIYNGNLVRIL